MCISSSAHACDDRGLLTLQCLFITRHARCTAFGCAHCWASLSGGVLVLQIMDMSPGSTLRLAATPLDACDSQEGVLRWMETYADALASGMFKVSTAREVCNAIACCMSFEDAMFRHPSRISQLRVC